MARKFLKGKVSYGTQWARDHYAQKRSLYLLETRPLYIEKLGGKCDFCQSKEELTFYHKKGLTRKKDGNNGFVHLMIHSPNKAATEYKNYGLRCSKCLYKITLNKGRNSLQHGTLAMFNRHKCRCSQCVEASRTYQRNYKRKYAESKLAALKLLSDQEFRRLFNPALRPKK